MARKSFAARVKAGRGLRPRPAPLKPRPEAGKGGAAATPSAPQPIPPSQREQKPPLRGPAKPQAEPDEGFVAVGRVLAPFGLKGELKVQPLTDNPARFRPNAKLWAGQQPVSVATSREALGYVYLTLKGFHDRTSVEKFRHAMLQVPESALPPLPEGEYYRFQLLGLTVVHRDGRVLGTLDEIIQTGANDVYRVRAPDGGEVLIPALTDVIVSVDLDARRMVVDPPEWR